MKRVLLSCAFCYPMLLAAQQGGIDWTTGLSWPQLIAKAKIEGKYIFLDCFATWCGPCHEMDKNVYTSKQVADVLNKEFISVKIQMDRTAYDNDEVKKWYEDGERMARNYAINAFPTFLFFSPNGKPLHRSVGYKDQDEFLTLVDDAKNPDRQYYALLDNYQPGKLDTAELKGLARALRDSGGELPGVMAAEYLSRIPPGDMGNSDNILLMAQFSESSKIQQLAASYLSKVSPKQYTSEDNFLLIRSFSSKPLIKKIMIEYLAQLNGAEMGRQLKLLKAFKDEPEAKPIAEKYIRFLKSNDIFTKETVLIICDFTLSSRDEGFAILRQNLDRVNDILKNNYSAAKVIEYVVTKEEYEQFCKDALSNDVDNVPWSSIAKTVEDKYGKAMAEKLDVEVKSSFYRSFAEKKDRYWPEYIKYYIEKIEKNGYDTTHPQIQFLDVMQLNNFVFRAIFYHSTDTQQMNIGLKWMEGVIRRNPKEANNIDTYANLLYKLGRKNEAIRWQEKAIQAAVTQKEEWILSSLQGNLAKMKRGEPTWIKEEATN